MHRTTLISVIVCCLGLLSIVAAQAQCGPGLGSCTGTHCCSVNGFCGDGLAYCGSGCQTGFGAPCGEVPVPSSPSTGPTATTDLPPSSSTGLPITPTTLTTTTDLLPTTTIVPTTTSTTTTDATTASASSTSSRATFQIQPTGKPSSGSAFTQDKSRLALVIVFLAGLFMI
ncbi:hypothetical protein BGX29_001005 [Mortierella sp. GBA35]|nr:hypothetical protein BGX23_009302 [Mortierella sp. AD031]KAF9087156.1 hypothetical protein BGX29_001005 [Mortierella sp. GBA35]KAG0198477.1 hypothetical protein BGX33_012316 [Mortierella sp. NVP41]